MEKIMILDKSVEKEFTFQSVIVCTYICLVFVFLNKCFISAKYIVFLFEI